MIYIKRNNFSTSANTLSIIAANPYVAGIEYGKAVKISIRTILQKNKSPKETNNFLTFAQKVKTNPLFTIKGANVLETYLDIFYGYCEGAGLTREEGIMLQAGVISGCQTFFIQNRLDHSIGFLHTEENFDDRNLAKLYHYVDSHEDWTPDSQLPNEIESLYVYKMVDMKIRNADYTFFGYPELCFEGPAMGINRTTGTCMMVDTINPYTEFSQNALWANAVVSMVFLIGDVDEIRIFLRRLDEADIHVHNGYAIHLVNVHTQMMASFEIGGNHVVEIPSEIYDDRRCIAQVNYPRSSMFQNIDDFTMNNVQRNKWNSDNAQIAIEMERRLDRLQKVCRSLSLPFDRTFFTQMEALMYTSDGDLETDFFDQKLKSFTGLISPCLAGYMSGLITLNRADIHFGKLFPSVSSIKRPRLWYPPGEPVPDGSIDLYARAQTYKPSI